MALSSVALGPDDRGYHESFRARKSFEPLDGGYETRNPLHNHHREACTPHAEDLAADNHHQKAQPWNVAILANLSSIVGEIYSLRMRSPTDRHVYSESFIMVGRCGSFAILAA